MKRIISIVTALFLVLNLFAGIGINSQKAKATVSNLPFSLTAPSKITISPNIAAPNDTSKTISFGMAEDQLAFMSKSESDRLDIIKEMGYDNLVITLDVDWAIDNPEGWHYNEYWNWQNPNTNFGNGYDRYGDYRLNAWDVAGEEVTKAQAMNDLIIFKYNKADVGDVKWIGSEKTPGLEKLLDPTWYTLGPDNSIQIDWNHHTLYCRARWQYVAYIRSGTQIIRDTIATGWSETASFGAGASDSTTYKASTMPVPDISSLAVSDVNTGEYPLADFDLTVPEDVVKAASNINTNGGSFIMEAYARVYGNAGWQQLAVNTEIRSTHLQTNLTGLILNQQPITASAPVELRARYVMNPSGNKKNIYSDWSTVLTCNTGSIVTPSKITRGLDVLSAHRFLTEAINSDKNVPGSSFSKLHLCQGSFKKAKAHSLKWNKVKGAARYAVYANKSGNNSSNKSFYRYDHEIDIEGTKATLSNIGGRSVASGKSYKFIVIAIDKNNRVLCVSPTIHIVTTGGKYTNPKSLKVTKKSSKNAIKSLTISRRHSIQISASCKKADKKLAFEKKSAIRYESSNSAIATVSSKGVIKAGKKKGSCVIYVYASNGVYKAVKLKVK